MRMTDLDSKQIRFINETLGAEFLKDDLNNVLSFSVEPSVDKRFVNVILRLIASREGFISPIPRRLRLLENLIIYHDHAVLYFRFRMDQVDLNISKVL